jgi:hypothetical protein
MAKTTKPTITIRVILKEYVSVLVLVNELSHRYVSSAYAGMWPRLKRVRSLNDP